MFRALLPILLLATPCAAQISAPPKDVEGTIRERLRDDLKDAESARIRVTRGPRKASFSISETHAIDGFAVCARVNAKNSYGAYSGEQPYVFLFWGEKEQKTGAWQEGDQGVFAEAVNSECAKPAD